MGEILTPEKFNEALADLAFDRWGDSELRGHDTALRAALAEEKRAHEVAIAQRDLHWREVESLRERLDKEEEERGRQYGLRTKAEAEMERLLSLVKEWLDGNARLGRPKSIADQRFLDGLIVAATPTFSHWCGTATKPEEP